MKIAKKINVTKKRVEHYDPIGDQIDRITKALAHLSQQGIDIGDSGREQVERCADVKDKFIKK